MKMLLFSYAFEENTITNYLRTSIAWQVFGSLKNFFPSGEGICNCLLNHIPECTDCTCT